MDAKKAREIADGYNKDFVDKQYFDIINTVSEECKKGSYEFYYKGSVKPFVAQKLISEGYKLKYESHRNETTTKISW